TDSEIPAILEAAKDAGAKSAGMVPLRLPFGVSELFQHWLEQHFPDRKEKILGRIRGMRGGKLNNPKFGSRMKSDGPIADAIRRMFNMTKKKLGLGRSPELSAKSFRRPNETRAVLFE